MVAMDPNPDRHPGDRLSTDLLGLAAAGALATVTMDATMVLAGMAGGPSFNSDRLAPEMIGRWAAGLLRGQFRHQDISVEGPIRGELALGLVTHYATGIGLTAAFMLARRRAAGRFREAVAYGVATSVLPLMVLFPSLGYGWFGTRSGEALRLTRIMLVGHVAFGAGIGIWGPRFAHPGNLTRPVSM